MNMIQQIFRAHGGAYLERYGDAMPRAHHKVIHAICNCGTGAYLQHVLPHGFTKVRHYGFMAANCRVPMQKIRELICVLYELIADLLSKEEPKRKPWICKACGGLIRWREFIPCPRGVG